VKDAKTLTAAIAALGDAVISSDEQGQADWCSAYLAEFEKLEELWGRPGFNPTVFTAGICLQPVFAGSTYYAAVGPSGILCPVVRLRKADRRKRRSHCISESHRLAA